MYDLLVSRIAEYSGNQYLHTHFTIRDQPCKITNEKGTVYIDHFGYKYPLLDFVNGDIPDFENDDPNLVAFRNLYEYLGIANISPMILIRIWAAITVL